MMKKIFLFSLAVILNFSLYAPLQASETGGTINPGLVTGMDGVVIAAPTASPVAGTYHATQSVTLTADGQTAICYTTDDTTPTCATPTTCTTGNVYESAILVTLTDTIKSRACYADGSFGPVATDTYTLTCTTSSVSNGTVASYPSCAVSCNSGYTLSNGSCVAAGGSVGGFTPSITTTTITPTTNTITNTSWTTGNWMKTSDISTVYFVDDNKVRHAYPSEAIWRSYFDKDFSFVDTTSTQDLYSYPLGKNVPFKSGTLIKIPSVPKVYLVGDNGLIQWIKTEATAIRLYGENWAKLVKDLNEAFFGDYITGEDIE
ncbi:MAG: FN3 associated domain-containing protein [Patescibacteria group bacterium]|nr:FN3 associated domain-containing protein [Patescibacteria group bacterium]